MQATTILFVRHGEVHNPDHILYERLPGFHLSDRGRRMAEATARYLAASPQTNTAAAVYSSPLDRTRETAQAILTALNETRMARNEEPLELVTDQRIIEAGNNFRGKRIGHGEGALWRNGNWKLVTNLWKPSWGESYRQIGRSPHASAHSPRRRSRSTPAGKSSSSPTNPRSGPTATCWKPGTPNTTCCCGTRRSPRSRRSPTTRTAAM